MQFSKQDEMGGSYKTLGTDCMRHLGRQVLSEPYA